MEGTLRYEDGKIIWEHPAFTVIIIIKDTPEAREFIKRNLMLQYALLELERSLARSRP